MKGWVTSGTEFRKILSPLPCQLLPSSNISHLMRHHYSEAKHSRIKTINGTTSLSSATTNSISISERERYMTKRRNDSLCEADGLPAIFPHQHQEKEEEERDTSSRTFPIRWLHNYHPHPSEHMFDHVCSTKVLHLLNRTFAQTQSKLQNFGGLQQESYVEIAVATIVCFIFWIASETT